MRSARCCYLDFRETLPAIIIQLSEACFRLATVARFDEFALFEYKIEVDCSGDRYNISEKVELEGECWNWDP